MKIVKKILIAIVVLVAIILIAALFIKKDMKAEREVVINKPKQEVYDYIKMLKNQNSYSKWARKDPNMKKDYRGTDNTVGFVSAWESDNGEVGKGEQEIKKIDEGKRIDYELRFMKPMESTAAAYMITDSLAPSQTRVKWGFVGNISYPFNFIRLFMDMEKSVGDDFEEGLRNLKGIVEKQ